jgi:hypothetical protein
MSAERPMPWYSAHRTRERPPRYRHVRCGAGSAGPGGVSARPTCSANRRRLVPGTRAHRPSWGVRVPHGEVLQHFVHRSAGQPGAADQVEAAFRSCSEVFEGFIYERGRLPEFENTPDHQRQRAPSPTSRVRSRSRRTPGRDLIAGQIGPVRRGVLGDRAGNRVMPSKRSDGRLSPGDVRSRPRYHGRVEAILDATPSSSSDTETLHPATPAIPVRGAVQHPNHDGGTVGCWSLNRTPAGS